MLINFHVWFIFGKYYQTKSDYKLSYQTAQFISSTKLPKQIRTSVLNF